MIVGTAGHIDHGKTTLVHALTGVDTDRLPEEKRRGITIDLGYAFMDTAQAGERIGFVDVPGHERLVHTMLAGATGIDLALLLVAADDGVMPQTSEHLAVLSLLGIGQGVVAVTKCDRVDQDRVHTVCQQIRQHLQGTALEAAPVLPVSAHTGLGLGDLKNLLLDAARQQTPHQRLEHAFRLGVDRVFTLDGTGTVVTGTVHAGQVRVGDGVQLVPGNQLARVRSIHAQNRPTPQANAGQRCALALVGLGKDDIARGQWLVQPDIALATERIDARLSLWRDETQPLRSGTPVHVHIGAESVFGTVAILEPVVLEPGQDALVQLVLRKPLAAWHGDRVILRDASASRTLAGGSVLDPYGPVRYRRTPQRLAELHTLSLPDAAEQLVALLQVSPQGVDVRKFARAHGATVPTLAHGVLHQGDWAMSTAQAELGAQHTLAALASYHENHAEELGPDSARLRRLALPRWPLALWEALLDDMRRRAQVQVHGAFVHLPDHGLALSATEQRIAQKVAADLSAAGYEGAWVRDLARSAAEPEALVRVTLARLAQRGDLYQVVKDLYYPPSTMADCAAKVRAIAQAHAGEVVAAQFRDATALGRKRAIQILEYFDRIGLLRRVGDTHKLRTDSKLFTQEGP